MDRQLDAAAILTAWENGIGRAPLDRAILLLWQAGADGDIAGWPLSERDRRLLALRRATFGDRLPARADCPDCGAEHELELDLGALDGAIVPPEPELISAAGCTARLREPTTHDLAEVAALGEDDLLPALRGLLASTDEGPMPATLAEVVDARIEARAAEAELVFQLSCRECGAVWSEVLDIGAYLWSEIETTAHRIMGDVAEIAEAFGWSESEILAMARPRRESYLALARMR